VDDQTWLNYLLERMQDIPPEKRTAAFISGWALITPDGSEYTYGYRSPFYIATQPIRPLVKGSPISSVRVGPEDDLKNRQAQIQEEWKRWEILDKLRVTET
jgi:hypothetical protein